MKQVTSNIFISYYFYQCILCHRYFVPKISSSFIFPSPTLVLILSSMGMSPPWKEDEEIENWSPGHCKKQMTHHQKHSHLTDQAENISLTTQTEDHHLPSSFEIKKYLQRNCLLLRLQKVLQTVNQRDKTAFSGLLEHLRRCKL